MTTLLDAHQKILEERVRQITEEGWTEEHDDEHSDGELIRASVIYYQHAVKPEETMLNCRQDGAPLGWPWHAKWWKPKTPMRDLERAGALVLAERERLQRKRPEAYIGHCGHKLARIVAALRDAMAAPAAGRGGE